MSSEFVKYFENLAHLLEAICKVLGFSLDFLRFCQISILFNSFETFSIS